MAKTIKFNLICDGKPIRTMEDLRNNFSIEDILEYYNNKLLHRWLSVRGYSEELEKVEALNECEDLALIKNLINIFEVESDSSIVEKDTYILAYKKEQQFLMREYEKQAFKVSSVINDYLAGYRQLVNTIIDNKDDMACIKASMKEIDENYHDLYELDFRALFNVSLLYAPLAIFAMLMRENMRSKYLLDESDKEDTKLYLNKDKAEMYKEICGLLRSYDELSKLLGVTLREFAGVTDGYWKDVESKGKRYLILKIEPGNFVRSSGVSGGDMYCSTINDKFVILDGIDYKSNNENHKLLYMEV